MTASKNPRTRALPTARCPRSATASAAAAGSSGAWSPSALAPRDEGEPGRAWLEEALHAVGAQGVHHGGHHRYAAYIGPRTGRRLAVTSYPYPKADQGGAAA